MKLVFRVDASHEMGAGHLMRCLTLAQEWRARGAVCQFICREHPGNLIALVRDQGFAVAVLPGRADFVQQRAGHVHGRQALYGHWLGEDCVRDAQETLQAIAGTRPDWLVVDHYGIDAEWETLLRPHVARIMVIDDLADRRHDCHLLLDQNFYADMAARYRDWLPVDCITLLGPEHVLLRSEFIHARRQLRQRDGVVRRILVFFGGSDITNQTGYVLEALGRLGRVDIAVDVVIGAANPYRGELEAMAGALANVTLHCQVSNMAELIARADLGIGAGGSAMWERCYLGLPTLTVTFADNQVRTTEDVAGLGAISYLGACNAFAAQEYEDAIVKALEAPAQLQCLTEAGLALVRPGTQQIADVMQGR